MFDSNFEAPMSTKAKDIWISFKELMKFLGKAKTFIYDVIVGNLTSSKLFGGLMSVKI